MKKLRSTPPFRDGFQYNVQRASFGQLAELGYVVERIDDGATQLEWDEECENGMPEAWKRPQGVIMPETATFSNATLYHDGTVLLPPKGRSQNFIFYAGSSYGGQGGLLNCDQDQFLAEAHKRSSRHEGRIAVSGKCFSTRTNMQYGPAHFIHDVLTRIYYENLGVIARGRDKIIAPPAFQFPVQRVLFEKVFDGYEIVHAPDGVALDVEELVIPANLCGAWAFNPKGIVELATRLRRILASYVGPMKHKVCVSRRDGNKFQGRGFTNMEEFENMLRDMGYKIAIVSELDPDTQFRLFANTTQLIGVHGSGMVNTLMMPPRGKHTEIIGAPHIDMYTGKQDFRHMGGHICELRIAMAIGHRVRVIACASNRDAKQRPVINLEWLKKHLHLQDVA